MYSILHKLTRQKTISFWPLHEIRNPDFFELNVLTVDGRIGIK